MKTFKFYGVCDTTFKLDDVVWQAIEDPQDGYRSMMEKIGRVESISNLTFSSVPFATVQVRKNDLNGYDLVDGAEHIWLSMGTDNGDSYYPCFVFRYSPPQPFEEFIA